MEVDDAPHPPPPAASAALGVSCTMELRNASNAGALCDAGSVGKVLEVLNIYNGFGVAQTMVHTSCAGSKARIFAHAGDDTHITLRTFPAQRYATVCIFTCKPLFERERVFFEIYDFLTQAFAADYDSSCISFVEHRA